MSSPADAVAANRQRYVEALKICDVATIVSLHSEDTVWMPLNEPSIYGRAELKEWFEDYFEHFRMITYSETEHDVTPIEGWAVERQGYMVAIQPTNGGERIRDDGRWFAVWKREADGEWRISQGMINSIRPVGSGTSRFLVRMQVKNQGQGNT